MYAFLTNCKNWRYDSDYRKEWIIIYDYGFGEMISEDEWSTKGDKVILHPSRGTFDMMNKTYVISSNGEIINKSNPHDIYKKNNFSMKFEEPADVLKIEVISNEVSEDGILTAEYSVTNTGKRTYQFIELETVLKLDDNSTITLDDFEIVKTENENDNHFSLAPRESGSAEAYMTDTPNNIKEASVHIKKFSTKSSN